MPSEGRHSSSGSEVARGNANEASIICHSNPPSFSSSESSEGGKMLVSLMVRVSYIIHYLVMISLNPYTNFCFNMREFLYLCFMCAVLMTTSVP